MSLQEQAPSSQEQVKEQPVFVSHEVARALSRAAGGRTDVSVEVQPDDTKNNLVSAVDDLDESVDDLHPDVSHATNKARWDDDVDAHSLVNVTTDSKEAAQAFADNLVSLTTDPEEVGLKEDADPAKVLEYSMSDAYTNRGLYGRLKTDMQESLQSGRDIHTLEQREAMEGRLDEYEREHAKAVSDSKKLDDVAQVVSAVNIDRDGE